MSVAAGSAANIEPPPLLFGQRSPSPSPASLSSPPQPPNPNHVHNTQNPVSSPSPDTAEDVDMSASAVLPLPAGQNHDREDAIMQDSEGLTNGHVENGITNNGAPAADIAVEVAAVDEDAMDTTPDTTQGLVLANGSADVQDPLGNTGSSPRPDAVAQETPRESDQQPAVSPATDNATGSPPPPPDSVAPPQAIEPPPPPPPPVEPVRSDSDSSDDDDGAQPWHPIQEDTSSPDENELKEIEQAGEVSGLNHEHWEEKAFLPLDEPEFSAGPTGRIDWMIEHYNGTKEQPNKDLVMKSPPMNIGGHDWQIKFYPKGNDSDYLSVYVECLTVGEGRGKTDEPSVTEAPHAEENPPATSNDPMQTDVAPGEIQHAALPLLAGKKVTKRKSVAAQVGVVLYNPSEPRVNYVRTCLHRFCSGSPDWGWTRFHGPYYDIATRHRGQRQALLRDDKLAFAAYIRIVDDETNCLWEHHSRDNPWDSFAMTGLQSLSLGEGASPPGGNLISAIASWMLFKPFRTLLYEFKVPEPEQEPFVRPKPLVAALQKVLYMLRSQVEPGAGPVPLDDVLDALEWYGVHERLDKLDVIKIWEILRIKMEQELEGSPWVGALESMFGMRKDYSSWIPSYRASVLGVSTMQEAVSKASDLLHPNQSLPQFLTIELNRQHFDSSSRTYVKLMNKVTLDENIEVRGVGYTLYGFVVHKQNLQSYLYHPIVRPEGPGTKWYSYTDGKDENMVRCLTKQQALNAHEGRAGSEKVIGNDPVAYIVMYLRDDIASSAFSVDPESEPWQIPNWLTTEIERARTAILPPGIPPPPPPEVVEPGINTEEEQKKEEPAPTVHEFRIIDSRAFLQHEGPGTFDAYDPKWQPENSEFVYTVELSTAESSKQVKEKLAVLFKDVKDPRQVKFWLLDGLRGTIGRPHLLNPGKIGYSSSGGNDRAGFGDISDLNNIRESWRSSSIWVHIVDFDKLPELPPPPPEPSANPESSAADIPVPPPPQVDPPFGQDAIMVSEDSPMSEPDEPEVESQPPADGPRQDPEAPPMQEVHVPSEHPPAAMEVEVAVEETEIPDPPPVDVVIPSMPPPTDTEMGGTQDILPPPPPPPAELQEPPPPPPAVAESQPPPPPPPAAPEEIYFFLKFFDAEKQTLESRGSHIAPKSDRMDTTVLTILGLPSDHKIDIYEEEEDLVTAHLLRPRRSFAQNDLLDTTVLIVTFPLSEEERNALTARGAFADPGPYLVYRADARNGTSQLNGHFTLDYFSSQYYKGEIQKTYRHGHGTRIYHSGDQYSGAFRLGQRHGHGLFTFQNGDTYDGEWVGNQQHGTGTFVEAGTGNTYVGGWRNDKKFGEGVTHWKNAQETERLCRICWEESAEAAFYDCGHVVACLGCARRVDSCPVCRKRVLSAMKLYYVV